VKLTDAGLETVLVFENGFDLPEFAAFPLVDCDEGRAALRRYYTRFLELARDCGVPFVLSAPVWRASPDWGAALGYEGEDLVAINQRAVALMEELSREVPGAEVVIEGCIGPRGDAYAPTSFMDADEAQAYHSLQLGALAATKCTQVTALTLTYPEEAIGIVRAATAVGLPIVVGFTVETDGRLPNGATIGEALAAVDDATDGVAVGFMLNCAHPAHFANALPADEARMRIIGLRANASTLSHAELDEAEILDAGDPHDLAERYVALRDSLPALEVLGGCCGTDIRHVTAIADAWLAAS
jgi:homocysteine S-methyltransferase